MTDFLARAGRWFLESGIQEPSGGVARYYRTDVGANLPVSSEITGYAVSALAFLYQRTSDAAYLEAAKKAARFLVREAWDDHVSTFPFEPGSDRAYFFDTGIIVRGLVRLWRETHDAELLERAREGALSLAFDFLDVEAGGFAPVISLPEKQLLPYEKRWSRERGCYQLKSASCWLGIAEACGEAHAERMFELALADALENEGTFLPGDSKQEAVMDRLHAYCYFLEALLGVADRQAIRGVLSQGIARVALLLRKIAPLFDRSDVYAQLLRVRVIAHRLGSLPLDERAATEEAEALCGFQIGPGDPHTAGGFCFGRKAGAMLPFANPVSTAFALQALALWEDHRAGRWGFRLDELI